MELNPYVHFSGNCAEAFKFYERALGGKITMMQTHGESPMKDQLPADWHDKVLHVQLSIGDRMLMGSDAPPNHFKTPQGFSLSLSFKSAADAEKIFKAISEGGTISMPFAKTFWSPGFGMCVDRFGIPWMVNTAMA